MSACHGNGPDHCCWYDGEPCPFLLVRRNGARRWNCGLYVALGSWDAVAGSDTWHDVVGPRWEAAGLPSPEDGFGCWDWPQGEMGDDPAGRWACCFKGLTREDVTDG